MRQQVTSETTLKYHNKYVNIKGKTSIEQYFQTVRFRRLYLEQHLNLECLPGPSDSGLEQQPLNRLELC